MQRTVALFAGLFTTAAMAQDAGIPGRAAPEFRIEGNINKPTQLPSDPAKLSVPAGYRVDVVAQDLGNPRILAVADDGTVYVTRRAEADVQMLKDADGDGRYELRRTVASRPDMHGIAIDGQTAYLMTASEIFTASILPDGSFGALTQIVSGLPAAGQHPNRTLAMGPDGMIYASVGSTCNACVETSPFNATMMRISKDGMKRTIHASGLRNTIGFDWNPRDGKLWGMDHGIDWLGDEAQPEELNLIEAGMGHMSPESLRPYLNYVLKRRIEKSDANAVAKLKAKRRQLEAHVGTLARRLSQHCELHRAARLIADSRIDEAASALRRIADELPFAA